MHARVTTLRVKEGNLDRVFDVLRESVAPSAQRQPGFLGFVLMVDRKAGTIVTNTYWDSEADMLASEDAGYLQDQISRVIALLSGPPTIEHYEVPLIS